MGRLPKPVRGDSDESLLSLLSGGSWKCITPKALKGSDEFMEEKAFRELFMSPMRYDCVDCGTVECVDGPY